MADTVDVQWLYPPNWDGNAPDSPQGWKSVTVRLMGTSDGTGETLVRKIDISELRTITGAVPTRTSVQNIFWDVKGFNNVELFWDRNPKSRIAVLSGQGGGNFMPNGGLADPGESGDATGDILLTSNGASIGNAYDITIQLKLKGS